MLCCVIYNVHTMLHKDGVQSHRGSAAVKLKHQSDCYTKTLLQRCILVALFATFTQRCYNVASILRTQKTRNVHATLLQRFILNVYTTFVERCVERCVTVFVAIQFFLHILNNGFLNNA